MMKNLIITWPVFLLFFPVTGIQTLTGHQFTMNAQDKKLAVQSFHHVWETIRDKHYDPDCGGIDWQGVYDRFYPEIIEVETKKEVTRILVQMIDTLALSHCKIIPDYPGGNQGKTAAGPTSSATLGCEVRILHNRVHVFRLLKGSPAHDAGISYGDEIISAGGLNLHSKLEKWDSELVDNPDCHLILNAGINRLFTGHAGDSITLTFRNRFKDTCSVSLIFEEPDGEIFKLGLFPPAHVWIQADQPTPEIGYISFNAFMDPDKIMNEFNLIMNRFVNLKGIILDLRGNTGGLVNMAQGIAGWFIDQPGHHLGMMCTRQTELKLMVYPRSRVFRGKIAVLMDEFSSSASEILAAGLRDTGRAKIFGTRSSGAVLASTMEILPNGDGFQYATAYYKTPAGIKPEGIGLEPDEIVPLTVTDFAAGVDPVIENTVKWIEE